MMMNTVMNMPKFRVKVSSLMTPASLGSYQPRAASSVLKNSSGEDFPSPAVSPYGFPFSESEFTSCYVFLYL